MVAATGVPAAERRRSCLPPLCQSKMASQAAPKPAMSRSTMAMMPAMGTRCSRLSSAAPTTAETSKVCERLSTAPSTVSPTSAAVPTMPNSRITGNTITRAGIKARMPTMVMTRRTLATGTMTKAMSRPQPKAASGLWRRRSLTALTWRGKSATKTRARTTYMSVCASQLMGPKKNQCGAKKSLEVPVPLAEAGVTPVEPFARHGGAGVPGEMPADDHQDRVVGALP